MRQTVCPYHFRVLSTYRKNVIRIIRISRLCWCPHPQWECQVHSAVCILLVCVFIKLAMSFSAFTWNKKPQKCGDIDPYNLCACCRDHRVFHVIFLQAVQNCESMAEREFTGFMSILWSSGSWTSWVTLFLVMSTVEVWPVYRSKWNGGVCWDCCCSG